MGRIRALWASSVHGPMPMESARSNRMIGASSAMCAQSIPTPNAVQGMATHGKGVSVVARGGQGRE